MFCIDSMVDSGLSEEQYWPSDAHRQVAIRIVIGNPNVNTKSMLMCIVEAILWVPQDKIETVTYQQLVDNYDMPKIGLPVSSQNSSK